MLASTGIDNDHVDHVNDFDHFDHDRRLHDRHVDNVANWCDNDNGNHCAPELHDDFLNDHNDFAAGRDDNDRHHAAAGRDDDACTATDWTHHDVDDAQKCYLDDGGIYDDRPSRQCLDDVDKRHERRCSNEHDEHFDGCWRDFNDEFDRGYDRRAHDDGAAVRAAARRAGRRGGAW